MRTLRAASKHCYLLESAEDRQQWGRYSFLGYAPTMEITCTDGRVIISEGHEDEDKTRREVLTDHPGKALREILEAYKSPVVPGLPPFTGSYADWAQTLIYLCEMTFTIAMTVGSVKGAQTLTSKAFGL